MSCRARPFRFGVRCNRISSRRQWISFARELEQSGFSVIQVSDHLGDEDLSPIPALMAAAMATEQLRLGLQVLNVVLHPLPLILRDARTLDLLSENRLEIGLGAGWRDADHKAVGLGGLSPKARVKLLRETARGLRQVADAHNARRAQPEPGGSTGRLASAPFPPVLIGGGGRRVLEIAGEYSDIVGLNLRISSGVIDGDALRTSSYSETHEKLAWVRAASKDRWQGLEIGARVHFVRAGRRRDELIAELARGLHMIPAEIDGLTAVLVGSKSDISAQLLERRERFGISFVSISAEDFDQFAPIAQDLAGL
jgi:probable F420-dependent oxidoreductase